MIKKIIKTKDTNEDISNTVEDTTTIADPKVPIDKKAKAVTNIAQREAQKAGREFDVQNIKNFQQNE